jgi:hypothetical protein
VASTASGGIRMSLLWGRSPEDRPALRLREPYHFKTPYMMGFSALPPVANHVWSELSKRVTLQFALQQLSFFYAITTGARRCCIAAQLMHERCYCDAMLRSALCGLHFWLCSYLQRHAGLSFSVHLLPILSFHLSITPSYRHSLPCVTYSRLSEVEQGVAPLTYGWTSPLSKTAPNERSAG